MLSEEKIIEFIKAEGGAVTNLLMREKHFGDVETGKRTISTMRKMTDEGKLRLEITHVGHATTIEWILPGVGKKNFRKKD